MAVAGDDRAARPDQEVEIGPGVGLGDVVDVQPGPAPLGDGRLRVQGVARDDTGVLSIRINELPLTFSPALEHTFEIDVEAIEGGAVVVEDGAGNRTVRALQ